MTARQEASEAVRAFAQHEHLDLARGIDGIHEAACSVGSVPSAEIVRRIDGVLSWFDRELQPHLNWEEAWLYPQIDAVTGTPWSTRAARFDHAEVRTAVERLRREEFAQLGRSDIDVRSDLRCRLFSLEALLRAHVDREEQLLLPILLDAGVPA
jgi:iron-sulfur cluster repair protein YtfE (RIC family)